MKKLTFISLERSQFNKPAELIQNEISFVLRLNDKNMSISEIGDLMGLSEERVKEIIKKWLME